MNRMSRGCAPQWLTADGSDSGTAGKQSDTADGSDAKAKKTDAMPRTGAETATVVAVALLLLGVGTSGVLIRTCYRSRRER